MSKQIFEIIRAPERKPVSAELLRNLLYQARKDTEWEVIEQAKETCKWSQEWEIGYWETDCNHIYEFFEDGPKENYFVFCPFCAKKIEIAINGENGLEATCQEKE